MICTQCGAYSEDNTKYCNVCGAPLPAQDSSFVPDSSAPENAPQGEQGQPGWSFVRAPKWPKPKFDLDEIDPQADAPEQSSAAEPPQASYRTSGFSPRPVQEEAPRQAVTPAPRNSVNRTARSSVSRFDPQPMRPAHEEENDAAGDTASFKPVGNADRSYPNPYQSGYQRQEEYRGNSYQDGFGRAPQRETIYDDSDVNSGYEYEDDYEESSVSAPYTGESGRPAPVSPARRQAGSVFQDKPLKGKSSKGRGGASFLGKLTKNNMLFFGAAGVLVVLLIVFAIILINKNFGGIGNLFSGNPILNPATVNPDDTNEGRACYTISIYARENSTIRVSIPSIPNIQTAEGTVNSTEQKDLHIYKDLLVPAEPVDGPTASIPINILVITPDGEEYPVEIDPLVIDVEMLNLTLSSPSGENVNVGKSRVPVSGTVGFVDAVVTVNGQTLSVDENGTFSGDYELSEVGAHTLTIEGRKNGYQIARQTITVNYTQTEADITIDKASVRAGNGKEDKADNTTVKVTTAAGATVLLSAPDKVTLDTTTPTVSESGDFSFNAKMSEPGYYDIKCSITKDGVTTEGVIPVERMPDYADYTSKCQSSADNYGALSSGIAYLAQGTVSEVLQTDPYIIAKLETSAGAILFEYHGTVASIDVTDTRQHNIYGDYMRTDEATGLPVIYSYFVTKKG
ncbi:hypothetical protein LJC27_06645 [Christensenellaceae bacterium OttesenSCG-928-M15]|nr:hypothetical protein [Christensenellaceae bacterium OttesenSCG-928-M15]